jgi:glycosyltransferase involved in cell wall biosynthesis
MTEIKEGTGAASLRVMLVQHASVLNGSTVSGRMVAQGFCEAGWHVDVVFGGEGPALAQYENLGCRAHVIPHKNWLRGGGLLSWSRRAFPEIMGSWSFARLMRQIQPNVVYVNSLVSLAAALAARRQRIPCVWHLRELFDDVGGEMRVPPVAGKSLVRQVIRHCASHVVVISRAVQENVVGEAARPPVTIVPNAVDDAFFSRYTTQAESRKRLGLPENVTLIGVPGTLRPMKGHEFFIQAAAVFAERYPECRFAITGDGEHRFVEQLRAAVRQTGLSEKLTFLGNVSDMIAFYRACDIVCVPSRAEPFGRIVIEAFAVGVPVVATSVGGIRETIADGETGLLVEFGDVHGLARSLERLLDDAPLRGKLAGAAHADALSRFRAATYHDRINQVVRRVAAPGPPNRDVSARRSVVADPT